MRLLLLCQDSLMRDGLSSLLKHTGLFDTIVAMDHIPEAKLKSGGFEGAVYVIESGSSSDKQGLAALSKQQGTKILGIAPDNGTTWKVFDDVVLRKRGFEAVKEAARKLFKPSLAVAEPKSFMAKYERLTPREREASKLVANAFTNVDIARQLGIKEQSVKNLISTIMRKVGVNNRTELAIRLQKGGY